MQECHFIVGGYLTQCLHRRDISGHQCKWFIRRRLRLRNSATATAFFASHASRRPPSPFTARIFPSCSSILALRITDSESALANEHSAKDAPHGINATEGPHTLRAFDLGRRVCPFEA